MAGREEVGGPPLLIVRSGHDQHQGNVVDGQCVGSTPHQDCEVRAREQAIVRFGGFLCGQVPGLGVDPVTGPF